MNTAQVIPFQFDTHPVRTLLIDGQPWFVAIDVAHALSYRDSEKMTRNLDDDEKGTHIVGTLGGGQKVTIINESGLYSAILRSRKPEAKRFKKWITAEVLPAIRQHGVYRDADGKMGTLLGQTIGTDGFHMLGALIRGKVAGLAPAQQRRATGKLWSQTHAAFGVRSAAEIPARQLDAARNFIAAYALEGDWLPAEAPVPGFDDADRLNLNALCQHMIHLQRLYRHYHLYDALRLLGSPAGAETYGHITDGAILAKRFARQLQDT